MERGGAGAERRCWRWRCDQLVLTETKNSRAGDYEGGVHCVVRGTNIDIGCSIGHDYNQLTPLFCTTCVVIC